MQNTTVAAGSRRGDPEPHLGCTMVSTGLRYGFLTERARAAAEGHIGACSWCQLKPSLSELSIPDEFSD